MWLTMGNRLLPKSDGCCPTLDTSGDTARDESAEREVEHELLQVPEPSMTSNRDSFEIMSHFTWEMVNNTLPDICSFV